MSAVTNSRPSESLEAPDFKGDQSPMVTADRLAESLGSLGLEIIANLTMDCFGLIDEGLRIYPIERENIRRVDPVFARQLFRRCISGQ